MVKGTREPGKFCINKFSKQKQFELFRFTRKRYCTYDVKDILQVVAKKRTGFCFICPKHFECEYEVTSVFGFLKHVKELEKKLTKQLIYLIGERKVRLRGPRNNSFNETGSSSSSIEIIKINLNATKLNNSLNKKDVSKSTNGKSIKSRAKSPAKIRAQNDYKLIKQTKLRAKSKKSLIQNDSKLIKQTKSSNLSINRKSKTISKLNKSKDSNVKMAGYGRSYQVAKNVIVPLKKVINENSFINSNNLDNMSNYDQQMTTPKSKSTRNYIFTSTPIPILSPVINLFSRLIPFSSK